MVTPVQIRRVATLPLHLIQQPARVVAAIARHATSQPENVNIQTAVVITLTVILTHGVEKHVINQHLATPQFPQMSEVAISTINQ